MKYALLDKITIIIMSYNRHKYLKRTIQYWSNYNVKLLVLDGSDIEFDDSCLLVKNIKYIHNKKGYYDRLLSSVNYIDTEFMILSCDDEFYLPSTLSACIDFLTKEESFSSCGGRAVGFFTIGEQVFGAEQYPKLRDFCLDQNNASDRIENHLSNYVPAHNYSVIRSNIWKKISEHIFEKEYNFFASLELQIEFLVMWSGKSKIIPQLMWMRNTEVPPSRVSNPTTFSNAKIEEWWHDKKFIKEKENFLYTMQRVCVELSANQNFEYTEGTISRLMEIYIDKVLKKELYKKNFFRKIINLISYKKIIGLLSYEKKKIIKKIIRWDMISTYTKKTLLNQANLLEAEGVLVNHEDLNQVILALLEKNNKK